MRTSLLSKKISHIGTVQKNLIDIRNNEDNDQSMFDQVSGDSINDEQDQALKIKDDQQHNRVSKEEYKDKVEVHDEEYMDTDHTTIDVN